MRAPYCTRLLAIFGAEVIKVERPGDGDPLRAMPPFYSDENGQQESVLFAYLNANKGSVELDIESDVGRTAVQKLASTSDVLVEDFQPGYLGSIGISPCVVAVPQPEPRSNFDPDRAAWQQIPRVPDNRAEPLRNERPDVVGRGTGPSAYKGGGLSGPLHVRGPRLRPDYVRSLSLAQRRYRLSHRLVLRRVRYQVLYAHVRLQHVRGERRTSRRKREHASAVLPCFDGHVAVTLYYFQIGAIAELLGKPELAGDPRFATQKGFHSNERALKEEVREWLSTKRADDVEIQAQSRRLLFTKVNNAKAVANSVHLRKRGFFRPVSIPGVGNVDSRVLRSCQANRLPPSRRGAGSWPGQRLVESAEIPDAQAGPAESNRPLPADCRFMAFESST